MIVLRPASLQCISCCSWSWVLQLAVASRLHAEYEQMHAWQMALLAVTEDMHVISWLTY